MSQILGNLSALTWQMAAMWAIGGVMIYLAICKEMEPTLLLPMGFGCILCNLPNSGAVEVLETLFQAGVANELFPLLLFIGIGAMIDFGPLLADPKLLLFGAAAQFGIFFTLSMASLFGFELRDAASIAIIGAADGPTSIFIGNRFIGDRHCGADRAALLHPPDYHEEGTHDPHGIHAGQDHEDDAHPVPDCGDGDRGHCFAAERGAGRLPDVRQPAARVRRAAQPLGNLVPETLMILGLGLIAFMFDTFGGVLFGKLINLFAKKKINPMIGAAGISAFPMSSRVIAKMAKEEDPYNFILMQAAGANVAGQVASVIAGGIILALVGPLV